jgi:hypothetical protein
MKTSASNAIAKRSIKDISLIIKNLLKTESFTNSQIGLLMARGNIKISTEEVKILLSELRDLNSE